VRRHQRRGNKAPRAGNERGSLGHVEAEVAYVFFRVSIRMAHDILPIFYPEMRVDR